MKNIIFDFDGTLADSLPLIIDIAEELIGPLNLSESEILRLRNMSMRAVMKEGGVSYPKVLGLLVKGRPILKKRMENAKMVPGLADQVKAIKNLGYDLYILSSNSEIIINGFLSKYEIADCFIDIQGNVGLFSKTSALKKFLKIKKIDKNDCLYIGDEVRDIESCHKLGLPIIAVTWGFNGEKILKASKPDAIVYQPADLAKTIERLGVY